VADNFFGWRVVGAAFVLAAFGWGLGFYGPPAYLHAVEEGRGWSLPVISAAVTWHFLSGAVVVAAMPRLHRRFGLVAVVRVGTAAAALGVLGWALSAEPWHLFLAATVSGAGWATMGGAALNAIVSPWFARGRPAALGAAFNGASLGGVVFSPLWVALIGGIGFVAAAGLVGVVMLAVVWWLSARFLGRMPAEMGLAPDGGAAGSAAPPRNPAPALGATWRDRRFLTLAAANALGLFAQLGLIAHLVSLLAPALGTVGAGLASGLGTICAMGGRMAMARLLRPGVDRRVAAAANYGVQAAGVALFALAGEEPVLLVLAVALFGLGLGNATSLPPLIAQQDFAEADVPRVVALVVASGQATYAFAPAIFGLLRELDAGAIFVLSIACQAAAMAVVVAGRRPGPRSP
jgi:MFS family permease